MAFLQRCYFIKVKNSAFLGQKIGKVYGNQPRTINFSIKMDKKQSRRKTAAITCYILGIGVFIVCQ
jgi:hypothetical protein